MNARIRGVDPELRRDAQPCIPQPGGRFIERAATCDEKRRVIFLGDELAQDLFGEPGRGRARRVQINQSTFLVIGVMQTKIMMGMYSGPDKNQATHPGHHLQVDVHRRQGPATWSTSRSSMELADQAKAEIYRVLGRQVPLRSRGRRARSASGTPARTSASPTTSPSGIQIFLGIIGALTLFVGGMGVANIMYAVVKERTREIGVKMALGAKVRQVMAPFVLEALLMTVLGGILGHRCVSLGLMAGIAVLPLKGDAFDFLGRPTFSPAIAVATSAGPGRDRHRWPATSRPAARPRSTPRCR